MRAYGRKGTGLYEWSWGRLRRRAGLNAGHVTTT